MTRALVLLLALGASMPMTQRLVRESMCAMVLQLHVTVIVAPRQHPPVPGANLRPPRRRRQRRLRESIACMRWTAMMMRPAAYATVTPEMVRLAPLDALATTRANPNRIKTSHTVAEGSSVSKHGAQRLAHLR